jgi:hypothetical protein
VIAMMMAIAMTLVQAKGLATMMTAETLLMMKTMMVPAKRQKLSFS